MRHAATAEICCRTHYRDKLVCECKCVHVHVCVCVSVSGQQAIVSLLFIAHEEQCGQWSFTGGWDTTQPWNDDKLSTSTPAAFPSHPPV